MKKASNNSELKTRNSTLVLGLVGPICSGKETVGSYIKENYDCKFYSLSDVIREELDSVGFIDPSHETLQAVGNILRKIYGSGVLTEKITEKAKKLMFQLMKYQKWQPALPLFYIFAISSLIVSFSAPFMNLLNGLGKVKITFSFMVFFTALIWLLTPWLTKCKFKAFRCQ